MDGTSPHWDTCELWEAWTGLKEIIIISLRF
jgi:hypothetical protein